MVSFVMESFHSMMCGKKNQRGNMLIECPATYQEGCRAWKVSSLVHSSLNVYEKPLCAKCFVGTLGNVAKTYATKCWLLSGKGKTQTKNSTAN